MKSILRIFGVIGVLVFGFLVSITFLSPQTVEHSAKGFVQYQIEQELRAKHQSLVQSGAANKALNIARKLGVESDRIQKSLDDDLPAKIASVIASMCGYDCERKKSVARSVTKGYLDRIKSIEVAQKTLGDIIKGKYVEIIGNLKRDICIFLSVNLSIFLIVLLVSFLKPQATPHLFMPGILLLLSTVISTTIYVFGQDWFYTILYNDYMGFGYLLYVALIFSALMDIVFNKASVTTEIINGIADALGSTFSVLPC